MCRLVVIILPYLKTRVNEKFCTKVHQCTRMYIKVHQCTSMYSQRAVNVQTVYINVQSMYMLIHVNEKYIMDSYLVEHFKIVFGQWIS